MTDRHKSREITDPQHPFQIYLRAFCAFKFESDTLHRLAHSVPGLIRGGEYSQFDTGLVVPERCNDAGIREKLVRLFGSDAKTTLPLAARLEALIEIDPAGEEEYLLGIDLKQAGGGYRDRYSDQDWNVNTSEEQRKGCAAFLVGFTAHPGWWAILPNDEFPLPTTKWRFATRRFAITVPVAVWPYMVGPDHQGQVIYNIVCCIAQRAKDWYTSKSSDSTFQRTSG